LIFLEKYKSTMTKRGQTGQKTQNMINVCTVKNNSNVIIAYDLHSSKKGPKQVNLKNMLKIDII